MPAFVGPGGRYNAEAEYVFKRTKARGVLLIVIEGNRGAGFSAVGEPEVMVGLSTLLRHLADDLDAGTAPKGRDS